LENKLEELEDKISNLPANNNVINISSERVDLENKILEINKCFSEIMKKIQKL